MQVDVDKMLLFFSKCGNLFWHQQFFFFLNKENMSQRDNCITLLRLFKFICKNRCACFRNAHRGMFSIIFLEYHAPWHQISFTCCAQSAHGRVKACREITQPRAIVLVFGPSGEDGQCTDMSEPAGRRRRLRFHLQELKYVNTRSSAAKDHPSGGSAAVKTGPENLLWVHESWAHFSGVPNRWTPLHSWILMDV